MIITEEGTAKGQREPDEEVVLDMKRELKDFHQDQREEAIRNVSDREGKRRRIQGNWMEKRGMKEPRAKSVGESLVRREKAVMGDEWTHDTMGKEGGTKNDLEF